MVLRRPLPFQRTNGICLSSMKRQQNQESPGEEIFLEQVMENQPCRKTCYPNGSIKSWLNTKHCKDVKSSSTQGTVFGDRDSVEEIWGHLVTRDPRVLVPWSVPYPLVLLCPLCVSLCPCMSACVDERSHDDSIRSREESLDQRMETCNPLSQEEHKFALNHPLHGISSWLA